MNDKIDYFIERTDKAIDSIFVRFDSFDKKIDELQSFKNRLIGMTIVLNLFVISAIEIILKK